MELEDRTALCCRVRISKDVPRTQCANHQAAHRDPLQVWPQNTSEEVCGFLGTEFGRPNLLSVSTLGNDALAGGA
jgi:hypothetical protein